MPTYKDLEKMVDDYLAYEQVMANAAMHRSRIPTTPSMAKMDHTQEWASLKLDEEDVVKSQLRHYQRWLTELRTHGVYDGPTTLSYHHRTA